jgi:arylamine N-acetyltransferase
VIETVRGDEAARLFLDHAGLRPGARDMAFLRQLAHGFSQIPYENISKIIKAAGVGTAREALRLPAEVALDHIEKGFGGTCFSLTFFLEQVLRSLGFDVYKVMADMNSGRNVHCLAMVRGMGAKYMIDPGYALYEVIRLPETNTRVTCPHAVVEVVNTGGGNFSLSTEDASGRKWRYAFRDDPVGEAEFERYWIESFTKPTLHNICLTRMTPRGHIYLRKDFFKFTSRESIDKRKVKRDVERLIREEFGIGVDFTRAAREILAARREATWRK